jgi:hypothetical protein
MSHYPMVPNHIVVQCQVVVIQHHDVYGTLFIGHQMTYIPEGDGIRWQVSPQFLVTMLHHVVLLIDQVHISAIGYGLAKLSSLTRGLLVAYHVDSYVVTMLLKILGVSL